MATDTTYQYLRQIGLSKHAVELYELLLERGPLSAQEAAVNTEAFASAQYRLFYELESRELVRRLSGRPLRFEALPLSDGLQASLLNQERQLESLVNHAASDDVASLLIGRQKVYDTYMRLAANATQQICIYAIGIAYSEDLARTQTNAVARGVAIRHVVQEVKPSNYYVIDRWLRLGVQLRTLKRPRGYHLTIIDGTSAIVTFSNPSNTEERVSLLTHNPNIISLFQAQFESVWRHAKAVV